LGKKEKGGEGTKGVLDGSPSDSGRTRRGIFRQDFVLECGVQKEQGGSAAAAEEHDALRK